MPLTIEKMQEILRIYQEEIQTMSTSPDVDLYTRIATRTGVSRLEVKSTCYGLAYGIEPRKMRREP